MTNDKMPDVIYALEGKSDTYDGIWDERQWSDQSGIEYRHSRIVEALKAENEELRAKLDRMKWQPIETAPTSTGIHIIAVVRGCDSGKHIAVILKRVNLSYCDWHFDGCELSNAWDITHWMPLPEPPK